MNYLKNKRVYLCGPIHAVEDDGIGWRDQLTPELAKFGLEVDDPCKKSTTGLGEVKDDKIELQKMVNDMENLNDEDFAMAMQTLHDKFSPIVHKDLRSVDHADFIIVVYDPTVAICGTLHEIIVANWQKKPVLIYIDPKKLKHFNPWMTKFAKSDRFFRSWDSVLNHLHKVDAGNIDTKTWTLGEG